MLKKRGIIRSYSTGPYNKWDDKEQWIRISQGCPNNCSFCYEPPKEIVFDIPQIVRNNVKIMDFITKMDLAYSIADVIISRAGAGSISELCIAGKPLILVPSPNVAENHQTKNAMFLVNKNAAMVIKDSCAKKEMIPKAIQLMADEKLAKSMAHNCKKLGIKNSTVKIVDELYKLLN